MADSYTRGLINDHVSVQRTVDDVLPPTKLYNVYARSGYNVGRGPEPLPRDSGMGEPMLKMSFFGKKATERGWGHVDTLGEKVTLDDAIKIAEPEAKRRGVVLYLDDAAIKIRWHPAGWEPQIS